MERYQNILRVRLAVHLPLETMGASDEDVRMLVNTARNEFGELLPKQCTMNNRYIEGPAHLMQTLYHEFSGFRASNDCRVILHKAGSLEPLSQEIIDCIA